MLKLLDTVYREKDKQKIELCLNFDSFYALLVTPPRNRGGVIFSLQFVCVSVCLCVCVSGTSCEQNSSRTNEPIWTNCSETHRNAKKLPLMRGTSLCRRMLKF